MLEGNPRQLVEADAHKIMDRYAALGGNFIDTANMYAAGNSERIVGSWLKKYDLLIKCCQSTTLNTNYELTSIYMTCCV